MKLARFVLLQKKSWKLKLQQEVVEILWKENDLRNQTEHSLKELESLEMICQQLFEDKKDLVALSGHYTAYSFTAEEEGI